MARRRRAGNKYLTATIAVLVTIGIPVGLGIAYYSLLPQGEDLTGIVYHVHTRLEIVINGTQVQVPSRIGIDPDKWNFHALDPFGPAGIAPLHTHDSSGVIHVESTTARDYTLGEFFQVWGVPFNNTCVFTYCNGPSGEAIYAVTVRINGARVSPNTIRFESIVLKDRDSIIVSYEIAAFPG